MPRIRDHGLVPGSRNDVCLSTNGVRGMTVAARRGTPVVLVIEAHSMVRDGFEFRCADKWGLAYLKRANKIYSVSEKRNIIAVLILPPRGPLHLVGGMMTKSILMKAENHYRNP